MTILIAAISENYVLGKDNKLLWRLPKDFGRFKELTTGNPIIMGRKTFESLPKLLPNRTHIVITRQTNYKPEGVLIAHNLENALKICPQSSDIYIIGGGEIYKQAMPFADKIELTLVHHDFEGDTFFPEIEESQWEIIYSEIQQPDEKHAYYYTFKTFVRTQKLL